MKLSCPACGSSRELPDGAIHPGLHTRCEICRTPIEIPEDALLPGSDAFGGDPPAEGRWYVEVRSGVYGPVALARVEQWIREKRVDWEDLVSRGGGPWLPALEQLALVEHFSERPEAPVEEAVPEDAPPVKVRRPDPPAQRTPRGISAVAVGLLVSSVLTLNLPGVIAGAGLFGLRRWAHRASLIVLVVMGLATLGAAGFSAGEARWIAAALGASAAGASTAAIAYLLRRRVRGYFHPGGGRRAAIALVLSGVAGAALLTVATRVITRLSESRQISGSDFAYTLTRPHRAWRDLPLSRGVAGDPEADLELVREGSGARAVVIVEERKGDARKCLDRAEGRIRRTGIEPTVYQARDVYAGTLPGAQEIVSVMRQGRRVATLVTCYADSGQQYQILGVAEEREFERVRPELYRLATSFRIDDVDDPMHLDIHTRRDPSAADPLPAPGTLAGVISRADRAVVTIASVLEEKEHGYGSGTLLRDDGVIVTNHHVVRDALRITVVIPGRGVRRARIVAVDPARDLALLKVQGQDLPFLRLTRGPVSAGDDVIAIGSPMGLSHTVTKGIVSSTRRIREGVDYLQTDVAVNPGNSGGPLLNAAGEVVGINTFILRESEEVALTGLNFAVAVPYVRDLAEEHGFPLPDSPEPVPPTPRRVVRAP